MAEPPRLIRIDFQPVGRRGEFAAGVTILEAARSIGVELASACGGHGTCGSCRVRVVDGDTGAETEAERAQLAPAERARGLRLACQTVARGDLRLEIPPESLTAAQRLQLEGDEAPGELDPPVVARELALAAAALDDLRSDATRLRDALAPQRPKIPLPVLERLPAQLRAGGWRARVALHRGTDELVNVAAAGSPLLGLAVDVGTTKLACYLVDLETGRTVAQAGAMNPQIAYGEDVLSRIAFANRDPDARETLRFAVVAQVGRLAGELCGRAGAPVEAIADCVVVGNTAMHHLFAGLPVRQLGSAPYVPADSDALELHAGEVGLGLAPGAALYSPPLIAGFVGADHVAMLLATGAAATARSVIALDIGTNTEITLAHEGELWSCSTASGPAFEGAHGSAGMRAAPGAIERVHYAQDSFHVQTVAGRPPIGLCGSGILDAVAAGLQAGIIDRRGHLDRSHRLVAGENAKAACLLVPAARTGTGRDIVFTRADVGEIQLARGAIRAGTELLLEAAGIGPDALDDVVVAGAFGTYLDLRSAVRVGLLPRAPGARFRQVGNAAGAGARQLLLSLAARARAAEIASRVRYLELTTHPAFAAHFAEAMRF